MYSLQRGGLARLLPRWGVTAKSKDFITKNHQKNMIVKISNPYLLQHSHLHGRIQGLYHRKSKTTCVS